MAAIYNQQIEDMVFDQFQTFNPATQSACICIIGQNIAMSEDRVSEYYVQERGLLEMLKESLMKGAVETRRDALWALGNLACSTACADDIMRCSNDIFDRIVDEYARKKLQYCRSEASIVLVNLFTHATPDDNFCERLKKNDLYSKINEAMGDLGPNHEATAFCSIAMLDLSFDGNVINPFQYQEAFGLDTIEQLYMAIASKEVTMAIEEFFKKHYDERGEMEVEPDDDQVDLANQDKKYGSACDNSIEQSSASQETTVSSNIFQI